MRFYTSNFVISGRDPGAVAISAGVPKWFGGQRCYELAPPWSWLDKPKGVYTRLYKAKLRKLEVEKIAKALGDGAVLLCWEKPGDFCHRLLVAEWLREAGHKVEEIGSPSDVHRSDPASSEGRDAQVS